MENQKRAGFTLGELCAVLLILSVVAAILFPVFAKTHDHGNNRGGCRSNLKQISLALLGYIQDYDGTFPPCAQSVNGSTVLSGWAVTHDYRGEPAINEQAFGTTPDAKRFSEGPLSQYAKNDQIFHCPENPRGSGPLSYMFNDLAAGVSQADFAAVANTVVLCDGEDFAGNVGHTYDPNVPPRPANYSRDGTVLLGATMQTAPLRHNDGANYAYADGHVKWSEPRKIFFPSQFSASRSHKDAKTGRIFGPNPATLNTDKANLRNGTAYTGTFHIK